MKPIARVGSLVRSLLADVREGLGYVWRHPVLRSISIMMALINFVYSTASAQLVLFAERALNASNSEVAFPCSPAAPPRSWW